MTFIQFILSDPLHLAGFVLVVGVIGSAFADVIAAWRNR